jgi:hypothetical protein
MPTRSSSVVARAPLVASHAGSEHDDLDVLSGVEVGEQIVQLEDETDVSSPIAIEAAGMGEVAAVDSDAAGGGAVERGDQVQRRGLSAPRRSDQHDELSGRDAQRRVVEHDAAAAAVRLDNIDELQGRFTHVAAPRAV